MAYRQLWVFLEGNDDQRFFDLVIKPVLIAQYDFIQIYKYVNKLRRKNMNFLKAIKAMNSGCFFLRDINDSPCVTAKKAGITREYGEVIDSQSIVIVVKEIESWYLAGLDDKSCKELGIEPFGKTDTLAKEQFNSLVPRKFSSRIDFMAEVLKKFSIEVARQKNKSFDYFVSKFSQE